MTDSLSVDSWAKELERHMVAENSGGLFGNLLGILSGTVRTFFHDIGSVEYDLTSQEQVELLLVIAKKIPLSEDLESLICGHEPRRYRILRRA